MGKKKKRKLKKRDYPPRHRPEEVRQAFEKVSEAVTKVNQSLQTITLQPYSTYESGKQIAQNFTDHPTTIWVLPDGTISTTKPLSPPPPPVEMAMTNESEAVPVVTNEELFGAEPSAQVPLTEAEKMNYPQQGWLLINGSKIQHYYQLMEYRNTWVYKRICSKKYLLRVYDVLGYVIRYDDNVPQYGRHLLPTDEGAWWHDYCCKNCINVLEMIEGANA